MKKLLSTLALVGLVTTTTLACKSRPSKAECEALFEHLLDLEMQGQDKAQMKMARQMMTTMKPKMVSECVQGMTREAVDCFTAATDSKAAKQCESMDSTKDD